MQVRYAGDQERPLNGICGSVGFWFAGEAGIPFAGRLFRANHWVIHPGRLGGGQR